MSTLYKHDVGDAETGTTIESISPSLSKVKERKHRRKLDRFKPDLPLSLKKSLAYELSEIDSGTIFVTPEVKLPELAGASRHVTLPVDVWKGGNMPDAKEELRQFHSFAAITLGTLAIGTIALVLVIVL